MHIGILPLFVCLFIVVVVIVVYRTLVSQLNNFSTESVHDFLTQVAQENRLLSWKEVMYLLHQEPAQLSSRAPVTSVSAHITVHVPASQPSCPAGLLSPV